MIRIAAVIACIAAPAAADIACGDREQIVGNLVADYGEAVSGMGVLPSGEFLEVFVNPQTRSWTILASDDAGRSCFVATGEGWLPVEPVALPTGPAL